MPSFPGRFVDPDGVERACVVRGRSVDDLSIAGDGIPADGRRFACRIESLGLLHGSIAGVREGRLVLSLAEAAPRSARIAARIAWHRARLEGGPELRSDPRVVPTRSVVPLRWRGGETEGTLTDVSAGGAALVADPRPAVGEPVTVGMRRGVVVRHTEAGIGIRFTLPLRPEDVTEDIRL